MIPISVQAPSLKEFMKVLIRLSDAEMRGPKMMSLLAQITGASKNRIYDYLEKLDHKHIKVSWSDGGRPQSIKVLKWDIDDLTDEIPKSERPAQGEVTNCTKCNDVKKIFSKGLCLKCYSAERDANAPIGICSKCGNEKKIYLRKTSVCGDCYTESQKAKREALSREQPKTETKIQEYNPPQELEDIKKLMSQLSEKIEKLAKSLKPKS